MHQTIRSGKVGDSSPSSQPEHSTVGSELSVKLHLANESFFSSLLLVMKDGQTK
jgi:hypothetical protein